MSRKTTWLTKILAAASATALAVTGIAVPSASIKAQAAESDEIMLGAFFTSEEDSSDVLYWSTNGVDFYELATAYQDATPTDSTKAVILTTDQDKQEYINKYPHNNDGSKFYRGDNTLHDPALIYKDGYFYMLSGSVTPATGKLDFYIGYSKDLVRWNYPGDGISVDAPKEFLGADKIKAKNDTPTAKEGLPDMVAPDFMVAEDGNVYIVASLGYYASWHGDNPLNDVMQPYLIKLENLGPGTGEGFYLDGKTYETNLDIDREVHVTGSITGAPVAIKLPCMDGERKALAEDHIDGSFYYEDGYYYFSVKENGVTDEIFKINDLSKVGDASAWEEVTYDVITGYEGPSLTKFGGQYYMYVDRLASFAPTEALNVDPSAKFGTAGIHVVKATINTTGKLDKYTGWLNQNITAVKFYDKSGNVKSAEYTGAITGGGKEEGVGGTYNGARHGSVITLTGNAAKVVRDLAKTTANADKLDKNPAKWNDNGWYYKMSYRTPQIGGKIVRYMYEDGGKRSGTILTGNDRGKEIYDKTSDSWYWLDAAKDGMVATASNEYDAEGKLVKNAYQLGEYQVAMAVDWDYYNEVGAEKYGTDSRNWKWVRYDYYGRMIKNDNEITNNSRFYVDGNNGNFYRYDPVTGAMVKGMYMWKNEEGWPVYHFFDLITGAMVRDASVTYEGTEFYFNADGCLSKINGHDIRFDDFETPVELPVEKPSVYMYENGVYVEYAYGVPTGVSSINVYNYINLLPVVEYCSPKANAAAVQNGWSVVDGKKFWYEDGAKQGLVGRGKEIYDPSTDAWYWLDSVLDGAIATSKDVYQESAAGPCGDKSVEEARAEGWKITNEETRYGKWVRYDAKGHMIKGWCLGKDEKARVIEGPNIITEEPIYYFDPIFGTMAKGKVEIDEVEYNFDQVTGVLIVPKADAQ